MQIVIDIPNAPIEDYQDLYYKIHGMAASEGLFDDKVKSQRALALKVVLDVLEGVVNGTPLQKGHGRLIDENELNDEIVCEKIDGMYYDVIYAHSFYDASTIIEADKESEDEK